jgi:ribosomal protein S18 acetylase RimI-like enzyme
MPARIATERDTRGEPVALSIRPMALEDVTRVAELQVATLPDDVWSKLEVGFVRLFYQEFLHRPHIAIAAVHEGSLVGFAVGSPRADRFFRGLLDKRLLEMLVRAAPAGLRQPGLSLRILRGLARRDPTATLPPRAGEGDFEEGRSKRALLMYMAVDPGFQRRGIGRAIVDEFVERAAQRGATHVRLKTEKFGNEATNAFYRRLGFRLCGESLSLDERVQNDYEIATRR